MNQQISSEVVVKLTEVLALEGKSISLEDNLRDALGADSMDLIELQMELEERFDIEVLDSDMTRIETVEDLVKCVEREVSRG